jgi:hypothetical protein
MGVSFVSFFLVAFFFVQGKLMFSTATSTVEESNKKAMMGSKISVRVFQVFIL